MGEPDAQYGGVTVLTSPEGGRYPCGNSLLIGGTDGTVLVDPSLEVHRRGGVPGSVDLIAVSHAHEDHLSGLHLFPDLPVLAHRAEVGAVRSPEVLLAGFGMRSSEAGGFRERLRDTFHLSERQDVGTFEDGDVVDLGSRTLTVLHLPGHTAGHCGFLVEPDGFLFIGDIDLTSFGPYYGDLSSSLEDFESSLARLREIEARWYGTSHQAGVLEGRPAFLAALDRFAVVADHRDGTAAAAAAATDAGQRRRPPAGAPAARPVAVRRGRRTPDRSAAPRTTRTPRPDRPRRRRLRRRVTGPARITPARTATGPGGRRPPGPVPDQPPGRVPPRAREWRGRGSSFSPTGAGSASGGTRRCGARTGPGRRRWRRPGTTWPAGSARRPRSPAR